MNFKTSLSIMAMAAAAVCAKDYSGAELYTTDTWQYGRFEARMRMAVGSGTVSSMFLYHNDSYMGCDEPWVEVDIEVLGKNPNEFQSNIITGNGPAEGCPDKKQYSEKLHPMSPAVDQSYHTYVMEWTPDYMSWEIDGQEVRRTKAGELNEKGHDQVAELRLKPQGLRFNLWASEEPAWVGPWDESILPVNQYINWVKVYKYTPGAGENGSDFTLDWVDDFDDEDVYRWSYGNWTFDGNRVDLSIFNATVTQGAMVLSLTMAGEEGFDGIVPADPEGGINSKGGDVSNPGDDGSAIGKLKTEARLPTNRGTFNAKGERVNKANASRYRIDFKL
ncbi:MAG: family 16 glycosylhydrolase [Fibrobacter sp.]|nr:family 16 glycosylhydrolase [Fibrobacter sp.]